MTNSPSLIHVYCMPGMSAKPNIFEHIKLPEDRYKIHWLSWFPPKKKESIEQYAKRMCEKVKHKNVILMGVSLGGILVQEMQKFIKVRLLVLISTVKTKEELPGFMKFGKKTKLYKILPVGLIQHFKVLKKLPLGKKIKKRLALYEYYLAILDKAYLRWGIKETLCWDREEILPNLIHIHGDRDKMFPIKNIKNPIVVKGGTHVMIINRFRWFNDHLAKLIEKQLLIEKDNK